MKVNLFLLRKQLILLPFSMERNPGQLRGFIEGVKMVMEVVHRTKHPLLLKFVESKITGDAKHRLLARKRTTWERVKAILKEKFLVKRTLGY